MACLRTRDGLDDEDGGGGGGGNSFRTCFRFCETGTKGLVFSLISTRMGGSIGVKSVVEEFALGVILK